jgi:predicted permease
MRLPSAIILFAGLNDLLSVFASDLLPIFVIAGAGFALARWLKASATTLTHVVFYALLPCFAFRLLISTVATGRQFGKMVLLGVLVMLAMAAVGALLSVALRLNRAESTAITGFPWCHLHLGKRRCRTGRCFS